MSGRLNQAHNTFDDFLLKSRKKKLFGALKSTPGILKDVIIIGALKYDLHLELVGELIQSTTNQCARRSRKFDCVGNARNQQLIDLVGKKNIKKIVRLVELSEENNQILGKYTQPNLLHVHQQDMNQEAEM